jgi:hypothetical protein
MADSGFVPPVQTNVNGDDAVGHVYLSTTMVVVVVVVVVVVLKMSLSNHSMFYAAYCAVM